jgi:heparin binding hemagglutinin HbhA
MPTTTAKTRKYPAPLYAAAGAGDLAYQTLRTLPAKLRGGNLDVNVDVEKLRAAARRNAAAFVAGAQAAQEKAVSLYTDLVARGEQVVEGGARGAGAKVVEIADHAASDAAQTTKATKPAKTTRPAAHKSAS